MAKKNEQLSSVAYFLYEGDTEEEFYKSIMEKFVRRDIKRYYKNLDGGSGINKEVIRHVSWFLQEHKDVKVFVYVFIDREGLRSHIPEFNNEVILGELAKYHKSKSLGCIEKIEAIRMIESWFFYDLDSICNYIGLICSKTLKSRYCTPEKFCNRDLSELFNKGSKGLRYKKGDKGFLRRLNIDIIYSKFKELKEGIERVNSDFS